MTPAEALAAMRDIHTPLELLDATSSTSDLAPWLALLWVPGLAWLHQRRRTAWRRDAASTLDDIARSALEGRLEEAWQNLSVLLRRLALRLDPTPKTASLVGEVWLNRLDELLELQCFATGTGRALILSPYRAHSVDKTIDSDKHSEERAAVLSTVAAIRSALPRLRSAG